MPGRRDRMEENPLWYKDAVIYEVHVKSFFDQNGDGIGDFRGLIAKLPYLEDLGITAVWVLPFYPSPLRDDGYDIADYLNINPMYGTLNDFREFLREAHRRRIQVIIELVLNHTSDQHAWFQRARRAKPGSVWRDYYVWSDTPDKYKEARIIFKDFESSNWAWDPVTKAYYWHRFYSHQPDLNFDNPKVHGALFKVIDFWFGMGVDGLRLDAVPYLYEREGTICENLPETYAFFTKLRAYVDRTYPGRMLLAEANQWPEDAAAYFGDGDACHMAFHFPLMPRMFMALQMEDRFPIIDILEQTPQIPDGCQWALFLRNHDELTLEMVTDEERDYMYRVYAQDTRARVNLGIRRRLAPLMGNDRRKIELMNVLLFTLPGTPIIYYGDEIGMGDNYYLGDRNGVRTPMQWSPDRNAGFSMTNPQELYLPVIIDPEYHYEAVNVETQARNPASLLWWMRRMIALRRHHKAFSRGSLEFRMLDNPKVLSFVRQYEDETIFVMINLSRLTQPVEINRPRFAGYFMEDLFSQVRFPVIKDSPYVIILGPHDYHLLRLTKGEEGAIATGEIPLPELKIAGKWENVLSGRTKVELEREILPAYLKRCRWFGGKGETITRARIIDSIPLPIDGITVFLLFYELMYAGGRTEVNLIPLHFTSQGEGRHLREEFPQAVIAHLHAGGKEGVLCDGMYDKEFRTGLFAMIARRRRVKAREGMLIASLGKAFKGLIGDGWPADSQILKGEQSNAAIVFDSTFFFKLYRRVEEGTNPEVETGKFLTETVHFPGIAPFAGVLEYRRPGAKPVSIGLLQGFVPNQGDAWTFTLNELHHYFDQILTKKAEVQEVQFPPLSMLDSESTPFPQLLQELIGVFYLEMITLLGKQTGELHLALASRPDDSTFAPEPFSALHQRSVYQSMRSLARKAILLLKRNLDALPPQVRPDAELVLAAEQEILRELGRFLNRRFSAARIRIHGDYHLGQVLFTGKNFVIIDFEGEPARPLSERKIKRSPLRDVAGMIRSFHYAAYTVFLQKTHIRPEDTLLLEPWANAWYQHVSAVFLRSYLATVANAPFIPKEREDLDIMLTAFILDKAVYELKYELDNRPDQVITPLRGIMAIIDQSKSTL